MATSLVAFRGRVFFVKDTPLQAAMYLLARELTERGASTPWLARWRERLVRQARWGGGGLIIIGLDEYPPDEPAALSPKSRAAPWNGFPGT
ncbi:MAG TPA: hypothetical protein VFQ39_14775 [Longimicrobium sp.]|nr:hypothetical protein [Longimicrobium sp.]